jgi:hypothetical protein
VRRHQNVLPGVIGPGGFDALDHSPLALGTGLASWKDRVETLPHLLDRPGVVVEPAVGQFSFSKVRVEADSHVSASRERFDRLPGAQVGACIEDVEGKVPEWVDEQSRLPMPTV